MLGNDDWPKRQNWRQIFVATRYEPPSKYGNYTALFQRLNKISARNYFNMTLSYRQDADIILKYHNIIPRRRDSINNLNLPKNKPRKQAVWIVSHCETPIKREKFVQQLQEYNINIDIYGKCGKNLSNICEHKDTKNVTGKDPYCLHNIVKNYKFYIAFENSLCTDYLTEKATQFMDLPTLPIIMSYGKVDLLLPPKSYINVFDFKSIKELADYILYLDNNFHEYLDYFLWRYKWKIETFLTTRPKVKCDLCDLLYTNYSKTYRNIARWLAGPDVCSVDGLQKHFTDFNGWG